MATSGLPASRLIVWPRRRRRPTEDTGYVLGWKWEEDSGRREVLVCAGVLSPTRTLADYRARLEELRERTEKTKNKPADSPGIVAVWTAGKKAPGDDRLPVIAQQRRGFPWWRDDEGIRHRQLVFYDHPPPTDPFSHYASEFGRDQPHHPWTALVHKLNHAPELASILRSGRIPRFDEVPPPQPRGVGQGDDPSGGVASVLEHSVAWLHFRRLHRSDTGDSSWFSCLAAARCRSLLPGKDPGPEASFARSLPQRASGFVERWNRYAWAVLDLCLGVGAAMLLYTAWCHGSAWSLYASASQRSFESLLDTVSWLEEFPVGVKLNVSLTRNMGLGIRNLMSLQRVWLERTLWSTAFGQEIGFPVLILVAGACGWTSLLAVLLDVGRLEILHLWVLTRGFRCLYQTELYLLSALFRLFRGKKRNVLRQRTDSMEYDSMQLLVGTVGFCVCIFLWTTLMVYYAFFVAANLVFHVPIVCLWVIYCASQAIPWAGLGWRLRYPYWFTKSLHLEPVGGDSSDVKVAKLCSVSESPAVLLLSPILLHLKPLFRWILHAALEILSPRSSNPSPCSMPFAALMKGFCDDRIQP